MSRAKNAKDAKVYFDKKRWDGRGLCVLSVLAGKMTEKLISRKDAKGAKVRRNK